MKIGHISDTHILTLKRHDEYREVFSKIYSTLREQCVDYIVHTGDLFHSKLQLTPECVWLAVEFLRNLANIAPTYIIAGNHDTNLRNNKRLDSISPIVEAINDPHLFYLKNSGPVYLKDVVFNVLSVFDKENWIKFKSEDSENPIIALYHGSIKGTITDTGYIVEHGDDDISVFEGHDYALLGDIHLINQKVDEEGRMRYAGSTVQQNFGEDDNKGFLIWEIQDKDTFNVKHYPIRCPKPFATIKIDNNGFLLTEPILPKGARIRLTSDSNLPLDRVKNTIDLVKTKYKPESVVYANKSVSNKENLEDISNLSTTLNLRDLGIQENLIREFVKEYNPEEEVIQKIFELNRKYCAEVETAEEVARNVNWSIKSFEWDNLFNYGENNRIDFQKLNGVVGILGKNWSGKSSVIESLLYTIYNNTAKNSRKNVNIVNQNRESARGKVVLDIDGSEYVIERKTEKYTKKSKGIETTEAKTDVEFTAEAEGLLTGLDRGDTDKNIRRFVGSIDDFLLTSMSGQFNSLSFIGEGSTNRKTILAKFLDLDAFDAKYKLAKSESSDIKALLKKLEVTDFDAEIKIASDSLSKTNNDISDSKFESESINLELTKLRQDLFTCTAEIKQIEDSGTDAAQVYADKIVVLEQIKYLNEKIEGCKLKLEKFLNAKESIKIDLDLNINELLDENSRLEAESKNLEKLQSEYNSVEKNFKSIDKRISLLKEVPCGKEFSHCKFIKDAYEAKSEQGDVAQALIQINTDLMLSSGKIKPDQLSELKQKISKYTTANALNQKIINEEAQANSDLSKYEVRLESAKARLHDFEEKYSKLSGSEELEARLESLKGEQKSLKLEIYDAEKRLNSSQQKITEFYKNNGYFVSKLESLEDQKADLLAKRKEFAAYDLYLKAMHANGISYQVIKNKLPIINSEINKILTNVVDFQVYLLNEDDKLDIMIRHPKYDPRPLEMGSGAEKSLASIAIRLALLTVSSLPKADFFILDEPGTSLDSDNLGGFIRILDIVKGYFKVIFLISHLDILKDAVDMQLNIENIDGFASINQ
jgi:DNA repair exonuclease SbcCD ATPase subunit/DNA repair exonuclease SbcCD nuclease subunit